MVVRSQRDQTSDPDGDRRPLLIIDGDSFAHRAYHGLPKTIRRAGNKGGGAILGFANMLLRFYAEERPRAVVVGWDTLEAPTYRSRAFPAYQSGRHFDDELVEQLGVLPDFVAACGFANAKAPGYEADDILAAAARREARKGGLSLVASGDRDAFQLASELTTILHPVRAGEMARIGPAEVRERYGVEPCQVPDFIALRGDPSDKLPGARGIGAKTAASLLRRAGSLEALLAEGRFADQASDLRLFRQIATMDAGAPLPAIRDQKPSWKRAARLASEWGLDRLAKRLNGLSEEKRPRARKRAPSRTPLRIATFNINNVNRRLPNLLAWLAKEKPDVVCLQELKAENDDFPARPIEAAGYKAVWTGQRSWNGVAILARNAEPVLTRTELPGDPEDKQARYIEAAVRGVIVASLYLPNGNPQPGPKYTYKLAWFERLIAHAATLLEAGVPVVLAGDYNVVPTDRDIYATRSHAKNALLQPEPREAYRRLLGQGWTDALRELYPGEPMFTFWDYKRDRWSRDAGLRLDHLLVSPDLKPRLNAAGVDRWVRGETDASDHAPAWIELS
jgi:exodeoxyribonuclease III